MFMKRISVLVLSLTMCIAMLTACTMNKDEDKDKEDNNNQTTETSSEEKSGDKPDENPQENPTGDIEEYKDGTYEVIQDDVSAEASHGWAEFIKAEVKNGKVSTITYDAINSEGKFKSETTKDEYPMTPHPTEWIPQFNDELKKAKSAEDIEDITGATNSSKIIKVLFESLVDNMKAGNTGTKKISTESSTEK